MPPKNRHEKIIWECPVCKQKRQITRATIYEKSFTGLCRTCATAIRCGRPENAVQMSKNSRGGYNVQQKHKTRNVKWSIRTCLRCFCEFPSEGPWNRICKPCQAHNMQFSEGDWGLDVVSTGSHRQVRHSP